MIELDEQTNTGKNLAKAILTQLNKMKFKEHELYSISYWLGIAIRESAETHFGNLSIDASKAAKMGFLSGMDNAHMDRL